MKILFVCKYNRFRSKVAEAYFNKINKNPRIKVESAGIIQVDKTLTASEKRRNQYIRKEFNLNLSPISKGLKVRLLEKTDKIIVVANDIPKIIFNNPNDTSKLIIWKIKDERAGDIKKVDKLTRKIINKVNTLVKQLENVK